MKILWFITALVVLSYSSSTNLRTKNRVINSNRFKLRNISQVLMKNNDLSQPRTLTALPRFKSKMKKDSDKDEVNDNEKGNHKEKEKDNDKEKDKKHKGPRSDRPWIGILSNLRLRGFGIKTLIGDFEFLEWGYLITLDNVEKSVFDIVTTNEDIKSVFATIPNLISLGYFHLDEAKKPDMKEEKVQKKLKEYYDDIAKSYQDAEDIGMTAVAASYRLYPNCDIDWIETPDESISKYRGLGGKILSANAGYVSENCKISSMNFYTLNVFPNTAEHPDLIHSEGNKDYMQKVCKKNKKSLQDSIKDYLKKYKIVLEIAEIKRKISVKKEEMIELIKLFGKTLEKWADLWFAVGLQSSSVNKWVIESQTAIFQQNTEYEFNHEHKIKALDLVNKDGKNEFPGASEKFIKEQKKSSSWW